MNEVCECIEQCRTLTLMKVVFVLVRALLDRFLCCLQVSTSSAVKEEKRVVYSASSLDSGLRWDTQGDSSSDRPVTVHFVLEESSGYMEPTLRILAILHTIISFFCIIGYYCLKVEISKCCTTQKQCVVTTFVTKHFCFVT